MLFTGALFLEEVVTSCGRDGIDAIIDAASKRFNESQQEKAAGSVVWWRVSIKILVSDIEFILKGMLQDLWHGLCHLGCCRN